MKIFPKKLTPGAEVRIVAPAQSLASISQENIAVATQKLESLGLKVTFGEHVYENDIFGSSSVQSRIKDIHSAFQDKNVKGILAVRGGSNSNQLLQYLDYSLIKHNPKILCGFSDITAIQNAIFKKTGVVTYSGPEFSSFAMQKGFDYSIEFFKKALFETDVISLTPSTTWSDDKWSLDQENRVFQENDGFWIIQPGSAKGTIIGGNISSLQLLHGTPYMPDIEDTILFLEADSITGSNCVVEFDRDLQSVIHQPNFDKVKALLIGRFEQICGMTLEKLKVLVAAKNELRGLPIIGNVDFGHTSPMITFPIGGTCEIIAKHDSSLEINLVEC